MKLGLIAVTTVVVLASCGQTVQAKCTAQHQGDVASADRCVAAEESRIKTGLGSAFAKSRRGGPG